MLLSKSAVGRNLTLAVTGAEGGNHGQARFSRSPESCHRAQALSTLGQDNCHAEGRAYQLCKKNGTVYLCKSVFLGFFFPPGNPPILLLLLETARRPCICLSGRQLSRRDWIILGGPKPVLCCFCLMPISVG